MFAKVLKWGKPNREQEIAHLEAMLEDSFPAVEPRDDYVAGLRQRLSRYSDPLEIETRPVRWRQAARPLPTLITADALVTALGVLSGAALLVVGIRAAIALLAALGLARQLKNSLSTKDFSTPARPV